MYLELVRHRLLRIRDRFSKPEQEVNDGDDSKAELVLPSNENSLFNYDYDRGIPVDESETHDSDQAQFVTGIC